MKRIAIITLLLNILFSAVAFSQETEKKSGQSTKDTLKIKAGDREILIIKDEKIADEIEALKNGKLEFKQNIAMMQDSISDAKAEKKNTDDAQRKEKLDAKISDYKKQIEAMEKGIDRIEEEIAHIRGEKSKDEGDFEFGRDFKQDFDWPFKKRTKDYDGHWAGIDIGFNNFMNADYGFDLNNEAGSLSLDAARSWTFALNMMDFNLPLGTEKVGLTSGLGIKVNSYALNKKVELGNTADNNMILRETGVSYDKNKLNVWHLTLPLLLEFQFPVGDDDNIFYFGGGAVGAMRLGAANKTAYSVNGIDHEHKASNDFNVHSFRYSLRAQLGFDFIHLFAEYSPMALFNQDDYEVYPVSIGLKLFNF